MSFESLEKKLYSRKRARPPDVEPAVLTRTEKTGLKKSKPGYSVPLIALKRV